ncbi:unnamed protein product, partial [Discosporangium mesarthrocarpum]
MVTRIQVFKNAHQVPRSSRTNGQRGVRFADNDDPDEPNRKSCLSTKNVLIPDSGMVDEAWRNARVEALALERFLSHSAGPAADKIFESALDEYNRVCQSLMAPIPTSKPDGGSPYGMTQRLPQPPQLPQTPPLPPQSPQSRQSPRTALSPPPSRQGGGLSVHTSPHMSLEHQAGVVCVERSSTTAYRLLTGVGIRGRGGEIVSHPPLS